MPGQLSHMIKLRKVALPESQGGKKGDLDSPPTSAIHMLNLRELLKLPELQIFHLQ